MVSVDSSPSRTLSTILLTTDQIGLDSSTVTPPTCLRVSGVVDPRGTTATTSLYPVGRTDKREHGESAPFAQAPARAVSPALRLPPRSARDTQRNRGMTLGDQRVRVVAVGGIRERRDSWETDTAALLLRGTAEPGRPSQRSRRD